MGLLTTAKPPALRERYDYAAARDKLQATRKLDKDVTPQRTHARDLLASYVDIMGGSAERSFTDTDGKPLQPLLGNTAISPDGQWLAASGERGTLALFERESGRLVQKLEGHDPDAGSNSGAVLDIVFHPQHPWLFSAGADGQIIQWQLPQGDAKARILSQWWVDAGGANALALSTDGKVLASGHTDGRIRLWGVDALTPTPLPKGEGLKPASGEEKRKPLRILEGHEGLIDRGGLAFDPQGRWLASASYDDTVRLWDWQSGETKHLLRGHNAQATGVAFSPDGQWLASSSADQSIILWDVASGRGIRRLKGHQNMVFGLQFINDKLLASASSDNTVRLWDVATGVTRRVLQGHTAGVRGLALYQDKAQHWLYSNSNDGTVKQWDAALPGQWLVDLPDAAISSAIAHNGKFIAIGLKDGGIQIYNIENQQLIDESKEHTNQVLRLEFSSQDTLLASGSHDNKALLWKIDENGNLTLKQTFDDHSNSVHAVAFSPDNTRLATASYDGQIGLFDLQSGGGTLFKAHEGEDVNAISFSADGKYLSSNSDTEIKLWDINTQPPTATTIATANDALLWASLSPDGTQLASVGREQTVTVYPTQGKQQPLRLHGHEQAVYKAIFSPDSRQLATVSWDMTVRLWDLDTQSELFNLRLPGNFTPSGPLWDFDFRCTPTGCWIAVPLTSGKLALYNLGHINYP